MTQFNKRVTDSTFDKQRMDCGRRKLAELDALIASNEQQLQKLNEMRREVINVYDLNKGEQNA